MRYFISLFILILGGLTLLHAQGKYGPIRHYTMEDGLSQMKTNSIVMDSVGYIWIGTRNGLNRFDGKSVQTYYEKDGLLHNRVHDLGVDSKGRLVIASFKGLSFYDGAEYIHYERDFIEAEYKIHVDQDDKIWISGNNMLTCFNGKNYIDYDRKSHSPIIDIASRKVYLLNSSGIFEADSSSLKRIIRGEFNTNIRPRFITAGFQQIFENILGQQEKEFCFVKDGILDCSTTIVEITSKSDYNHFYTSGSTLINIHNGKRDSIDNSPFIRIVDHYVDKDKHLWIAAENGFAQIQLSPFYHIPYRDLPYVWTVLEDDGGKIWAGTYGNGLYRSTDGLSFNKYLSDPLVDRHVNFHASSVSNKMGAIYFANGIGLISVDDKGSAIEFLGKPIYAVIYDSESNEVIVGGQFGIGKKIDNSTDELYFNNSDGLHKSDYIQNLMLDSEGNYWAGSYTGLSKVNNDFLACENYTIENNRLPSKGIYSSFEDTNGQIWFGGDESLLYYNKAQDSIVEINSVVLSGPIKSIVGLSDSLLLIGAKDGLFVFDAFRFFKDGQVVFTFFNGSNGYRGLEPGFTGFYKDSKGRLWLPSATSLDVLQPGEINPGTNNLNIHIASINGDPLPFLRNSKIIDLPSGIADVVLECNTIGHIRLLKSGFQYKVGEGDWSDWQHDNQIKFNDLDAGHYRVEVRAGPTDVPPDESETEILFFRVNLPFYMAKSFPLLAGGLLTLLSLFALLLYFRQRRETRKYSEQLSASKYLRTQLLLSELNPHFIFNVLSSIQSKVLLGDRDEASAYVVKLSKMIRNFLNASHQSHQSVENYKENNISLSKEIDLLSSYMEFEQMKSDDHFTFDIQIENGLEPSLYFIPPMLIQPFVENSIKHGILLQERKGRLELVVQTNNEELIITVSDDGVGRAKAKELKGDRTGHVSLGTMIIDQRIELLNELGYEIEVSTSDNTPSGTIVQIRIKE